MDVTIITNENNDTKINKLKNELNKILKNLNIFIAKDLARSKTTSLVSLFNYERKNN